MSQHSFAMPGSGLASRRGGQSIKPLSMDALKSPADHKDNGIPTPRTSRSHLLAGLRTAPKTASASVFPKGPASPTTQGAPQMRGARNPVASGMYDNNSTVFNGPRTSYPRLASQQQGYNQMLSFAQQQYTPDQVLAPPELHIDEQTQEQMDPNLQAQLLVANAYLAEQQHRLQQQLLNLQAAAQQFQGLNLNGPYQMMQQQAAYTNLYQQQQQLQQQVQVQQQQVKSMQHMQPVMTTTGMSQPNIYAVYDPVTGQQTLYVDQSQAQQLNTQFVNHSQLSNNGYSNLQQQQSSVGTPHVQVSPPLEPTRKSSFRNPSPPRRHESPIENATPLPPPSANAFRRGHKKASSTANGNKAGLSIATSDEPPKSAGPKTACFPLSPLPATGSYGPGQARAGEHPVRQPRNPPSMDELKAKPTAKHDGSKNFVTRTRRSAIHNLVRAGLERRKEARSSGSISPISESTEELVETPMTDKDSESGRSGSGSLVDVDDAEGSLPSSRTSTGSWGAIGSDRPSSRQKVARNSVDSTNSSDNESGRETGSFASIFKNANRTPKAESRGSQRKAPMLVLTSAAEKRKLAA